MLRGIRPGHGRFTVKCAQDGIDEARPIATSNGLCQRDRFIYGRRDRNPVQIKQLIGAEAKRGSDGKRQGASIVRSETLIQPPVQGVRDGGVPQGQARR